MVTMTANRAMRAGIVVVGAALLSACAGSNGSPPMAAGPRGAAGPSYAPATSPTPFPATTAAPSAASSGSASSAAGESVGRVGLGTEWGETRESVVHETSFDRASWSDPFVLATIRYNDRDGVESMSHARRVHLTKGDSEMEVAGGAISIALHGEEGHSFPAVHPANTNAQMNVVGRAGQRYTIVLTNHSPHRVEAVATVDGLDVMDGTPGSFDHRGYLLNPYASLEIDGFRKSENEVAAFRFGAISDSYAAQTGSARDVGVIGVALFSEKGDDRRDDSAGDANPFPNESRFAQPPR